MESSFLNPSWSAVRGGSGPGLAPPPRRLVLVESHGLLREGLAHSISIHVRDAEVQCYGCVEEVVPGAADLVLIGLDPRQDDANSTLVKFGALRALCDAAPIGVVLAHGDAALTRALGAIGIAGLIRREASLAVAIAAIRLMWVGGYYLPPELSNEDRGAGVRSSPSQVAAAPSWRPIAQDSSRREADSVFALTSRECDVLRILREGRQNKIIAYELGISESTVKVHLRNIMKKLHVSNRTQVALGAGPAE